MRNLPFLAAMAASLMFGPALAEDAASPQPKFVTTEVPGVLSRTVDDFIRPGYRQFKGAGDKLVTSMTALCATPGPTTLKTAKDSFGFAVDAWSRIEILREGPVMNDFRFERILFYPDRKSVGLKQVQGLITAKDESATDANSLSGKSVATQGLGALEYVLYGAGADTLLNRNDTYRCRYGLAIATNIRTIAGELIAAWDDPMGVQMSWEKPGPDNALFRDDAEAVTGLLGVLVHGAAAIRDERIETFYKGGDGQPQPRLALFWRSGNTFRSLRGNLTALSTLIGKSDVKRLLAPSARPLMVPIQQNIDNMVRTASRIDTDIERAVQTDEDRIRLDYLLDNTKDLTLALSDRFGGAIGLSAGFSFADGD